MILAAFGHETRGDLIAACLGGLGVCLVFMCVLIWCAWIGVGKSYRELNLRQRDRVVRKQTRRKARRMRRLTAGHGQHLLGEPDEEY